MSELRRYGCWAGQSNGVQENIVNCIASVYPPGRRCIPSQCCRKRGHGPDGLYCKQHAKKFKSVVDVCCGSRMFWFDKADPRAIFLDNRRETYRLKDMSGKGGSRMLTIDPDHIADFTDLPFPTNSFAMVVFDPPHLLKNGPSGWQAKKYGKLGEDWKDMLHRGFSECFRVLRPEGVLIFKWSEHEIPVSQVLALTPEKPLIGQRIGRTAKTHWLVFMKSPASTEG